MTGRERGVGTFAVQIAKAFGAEVTGGCSTRNLELVRVLGAAALIDYTREDFSRSGRRYDLMLDNVGNHSVVAYLRTLRPGGVCVSIGYTSVGLMIQHQILGRLVSWIGTKKIRSMLARVVTEDLVLLRELIEAGKITPVVDRCYPLSEVVEATRYLETGHARGKVVVSVAGGA